MYSYVSWFVFLSLCFSLNVGNGVRLYYDSLYVHIRLCIVFVCLFRTDLYCQWLLCLSSGTDLQKSRHVLKSFDPLCNKVLSYLILSLSLSLSLLTCIGTPRLSLSLSLSVRVYYLSLSLSLSFSLFVSESGYIIGNLHVYEQVWSGHSACNCAWDLFILFCVFSCVYSSV